MSRSSCTTGARKVQPRAPHPPAVDRVQAGASIPAAKRRRPVLTIVAVLAACGGASVLVAACSGAAQPSAAARREAAAPVPATGGVGTVNGPVYGAAGQSGSTKSATVTGLVKLVPQQSIIYTANLTLRVKDVTVAASTATTDVTSVGGYVASENQSIPTGKHGVGQVILTLKIPVTSYHATLTTLDALGHPLAFSTQAQDVTQQVADVSSRVASAQAAIKQLRALLSKAGSVGQLLSVQDEINLQEASLESLLAQQQALAHETSYGTVTLVLLGHHTPTMKKLSKKHHGLIGGLIVGWKALKVVVIWLLTALGAMLPFAIPVAVIGGLIVFARRRMLRRRTPPATTS